MRQAGAERACIVTSEGKWDILNYFRDGSIVDMTLAYLVTGFPFGVPYTCDQAYPFVKEAIVVFGFPDIVFTPKTALSQLLEQQERSSADMVLGLYQARIPRKMDMVELDRDGHVRDIIIKPIDTHLKLAWISAVWTPVFTEYMRGFVERFGHNSMQVNAKLTQLGRDELFLGDVIQAAVKDGIEVDSLAFEADDYIDIGTPTELVRAIKIETNGPGEYHDNC
jgi:glucose-1-phosphate thymidylyltransferase